MSKVKKGILFAALLLFTVGFPFVAYVLRFGPVKVIRSYLLAYALCYLAKVDIETQIVPNKILLLLFGFRSILFLPEALLYPGYLGSFLLVSVSGAVLGMVILFISNVICKHGMGMGDIKLFGIIGFYVGVGGILFVMFFALLFAAVYSGILLLRKKLRAKDEIPFVPFIFAGTIVTFLLGI